MRPYWIGVGPNLKNEHPINEEVWGHSQRRSLVTVEAEGAAISQALSAAGEAGGGRNGPVWHLGGTPSHSRCLYTKTSYAFETFGICMVT